jgi:hypothetical protein
MNTGNRMKYLYRVLAHLLFVSGMVVFYVLPGNKYDWMQDIDPSIHVDSINDSSGDSAVFAFLLLVFIAVSQSLLIANSRSVKERALSAVFILATVVVWFSKFWA